MFVKMYSVYLTEVIEETSNSNAFFRWRRLQENVFVTRNIVTYTSGVPRGGGLGVQPSPSPEIPKALQNRAKLNPIVKTVKNCWI